MSLLWPGFLLLLGIIPLLIAAYLWMLRRRRRFAVRYSSLALVRQALPQQSWLRRHLPFALFLMALSSLVIASSRPVSVVSVPVGKSTIILAIDVSRSMLVEDILPSRLQAAQEAALSFVQRQGPSTQIGIVVFAGSAELIQPPTTDQHALRTTIGSLTTARRTAIGSAILKSLDAIAEVNQDVAPSVRDPSSALQPTPVPQGVYQPETIVLLTDGSSNTGPLPLEAAQQAAVRGVRVYTIGFGTREGSPLPDLVQPFGNDFRMELDEATLKEIASLTGGKYYTASSAGELQTVFQNLPSSTVTREEITEISVLFTSTGALFAVVAIALSLIWRPLP